VCNYIHYVTNRGVPQYPGYNSEKIKLYKNDNETFVALEDQKKVNPSYWMKYFFKWSVFSSVFY
jgi:hypothetical protein